MDIKDKLHHTGTTTLGIICKDGVVLAADRRVSAGYFIADKKTQKVFPITDNIAVTIAGLVSDAQLISKLIKAELSLKKIRTGKDPTVKESANLLASIVYANIRKFSAIPGIVGFLLGGMDPNGKFSLYEIGIDGSITICDAFCSDGSGSPLAYGVLETLYKENLPVEEGVKLAVKSINAAVQRDLPTGEGIDVFTITSKGVKQVLAKAIETKII